MVVMPQAKARTLASVYSFQPPVRGLVLNESLANSKAGGALVLENWFPTASGMRTRGGCLKTATIGEDPVLRLWTFKSGNAEELFASDEGNIFNLTGLPDPDTAPSPVVTGQSAGYYSTAQFGSSGGDNYLYAVNGADDALLYDGSSYTPVNSASTPISITGITTAALSFVWSFASRLFFVEKGTMNVWYLPVDSLGGTAEPFSFAGVFQEGGFLVSGGKWSLDAGDGLDDKCVFFSSEGEVAVFQGTNPGSADAWQKVGVYKLAKTMGPNATTSAGGDLLVATQDGIVPISEAVNKDSAALSLSAVTRSIEPEWRRQVSIRSAFPWEIIKWSTGNMMIVSLPRADDSILPMCFVANLETGAWTTFTGWDIRCMVVYGNEAYFGSADGTIHKMDTTGSDDGMPYTCSYVGLPDQMRLAGVSKTIHSARAVFLSNVPFKPKISGGVNYKTSLPAAPSSVLDFGFDNWDQGLWDVAVWDAASISTVTTRWVSIGKSGFSFLPQIQITCGVTPKPTTELIQFDIMYERGAVMF